MSRNKKPAASRTMLAAAIMFSLTALFGCGIRTPSTSGAVPAPQQSQPQMQVNADGTVTLNLDVPHTKISPKPASDLPPGSILVKLPLYPSAKTTNQPFPMAEISSPMSPYVKAASAEFVLPVSEAQAQAWYQNSMTQAGYEQNISGHSGDTKKGEQVAWYGFTPQKQNKPLPTVYLTFQQLQPDQTLVYYWAYQVVQPPRPTDMLLPTDMVKLELTYTPDRTPQQPDVKPIEKTITDQTVLKQLVADINALPLDAGGVKSCLADTGQGATLHFTDVNGQTYDVWLHQACGDVSINKGRALTDVNGLLWNAVTTLVKS